MTVRSAEASEAILPRLAVVVAVIFLVLIDKAGVPRLLMVMVMMMIVLLLLLLL
ncbi:hypothetical protein F5Y09DRAFT_293428 [Xylaria sp. FL1042]|nr:hypothetical protein F5Y09DRAFT_293301 [Xylaria sp. FL1042]KAI0435371.1 hypothetical protein F5Y09DRAFT_293428 [Xylaria sp. FL1042]